jgi:GTP-binding protein
LIEKLRNIAIVAHVDHGKTTLVDQLLQQSGTLDARVNADRLMDTNDLERERGITIIAKNTSLLWNGYRINIVDTPGHADFGGEVERVLSMVDSVLLLVDAVDGPMPQTRFVTQKAFDRGFVPIVVINKVDRDAARPEWVLDQTFDLFDKLGASDEQLDFPVVAASATNGYASTDLTPPASFDGAADMTALFETIISHVPAPKVSTQGPFQMQISALDYSSYVGAIGIGRISRGTISTNTPVKVVDPDGGTRNARVLQILSFAGLNQIERESAAAGDIVAVNGVEDIRISQTLCDPEAVEPLPALSVDEPTLNMTFHVNNSPFAGISGKFVTSRQLNERLQRELIHNVALRVEATDDPSCFSVSGRGELHLSILIENMRREGYELAVGRPRPIFREIDGVRCEPFEQLSVDLETQHQGTIMERLGSRKGELREMLPDGKGRVRLAYSIPARGLIGFRTEFLSATQGTGIMNHNFERYAPVKPGEIAPRSNGVLVSIGQGKSLGFALFNLQERGRLFINPGEEIYQGMIVGEHARGNDLTVNPMKAKHLTNVRASGTDENIMLTTPVRFDLEQALEFIEDDELVEVTPTAIRLRKKLLKEIERKRHARAANE